MLASLSSIHLEPWFAPSWESSNDSNKLKIALESGLGPGCVKTFVFLLSDRISSLISGEVVMKRFIEGVDQSQGALFPERLEDYISDDNPVRVIDVFVDELDLGGLGFGRVVPEVTGQPGYHPSSLLKLYVYV